MNDNIKRGPGRPRLNPPRPMLADLEKEIAKVRAEREIDSKKLDELLYQKGRKNDQFRFRSHNRLKESQAALTDLRRQHLEGEYVQTSEVREIIIELGTQIQQS